MAKHRVVILCADVDRYHLLTKLCEGDKGLTIEQVSIAADLPLPKKKRENRQWKLSKIHQEFYDDLRANSIELFDTQHVIRWLRERGNSETSKSYITSPLIREDYIEIEKVNSDRSCVYRRRDK